MHIIEIRVIAFKYLIWPGTPLQALIYIILLDPSYCPHLTHKDIKVWW